MCMGVLPVCLSMHQVCAWNHEASREWSDALGLELQLWATLWILSIEPRSSKEDLSCPGVHYVQIVEILLLIAVEARKSKV